MGFIVTVGGIFVLIVVAILMYASNMREKIEAMSPAERATYFFGAVNEHLICPHCQTKGLVRAKQETRVVTSTGKVGGILKTDTTSETTAVVTQHHCGQCGTTWDI
ncbi:MAG: hypothetical protein Q7T10_04190 [Rhodoferax sp.]|uniref:hypothetical protein n=1 Tax=Rhodoferax sp. TaxID=50421 RepID=UPI0027161339|nr:hypothetical protein [Rhodoferax sp.]MDO8447987.1 hypothetical protein [Rhodoferax sp.]